MTWFALFALASSAAAAGLFAGLMMTLVVLLEPTWNRQPALESIRALQTFLEVAKGHPVIAALTFAGVLLPLVALVPLWQLNATLPLALTALGFLTFGLGVLGVTVRLNLPLYETLMGLDPAAPTVGWQASRLRFYRLNRLRGAAAFAALVCFLAALMTPLTEIRA